MASQPQPQHRRQTGLELIESLTGAGHLDLALELSQRMSQRIYQPGHVPVRHHSQAGPPPQLHGSWVPQFAASLPPHASVGPFLFPAAAATVTDSLAVSHVANPAEYMHLIPESDPLWPPASPSASSSANPGANPATIRDSLQPGCHVAEANPLGLPADSTFVEPLSSPLFTAEELLVCVPPAQWPRSTGLCLESPSQRSNISRVSTSSQLPCDGLDAHDAASGMAPLTPSYGLPNYAIEALGYASSAASIQPVIEPSSLVLSMVEGAIGQPEGFATMCTFAPPDALLTASEPLLGSQLPMIAGSSPAHDVDAAQGSSPGSESGSSPVARMNIGPAQKERARTHRRNIKNVNKPSRGKKNGPLAARDREEAKQTRKNKACARCYLNKTKCFANENDPNGMCISCHISHPNTYVLPCIRLKITDIMLFRLGPTEQFIRARRWLNDDWNTVATWQSHQAEWMTLTQDHGKTCIRVAVKRFYQMQEDTLTKAYPRYTLHHAPFAIADIQGTVAELRRHMTEAGPLYIDAFTECKSLILQKTFSMISSLIEQPNRMEHVDLLKDTRDLWIASRFIEKPWHVSPSETLDTRYHVVEVGFGDEVPVSPVMDQQLDRIIIQKILDPLKQTIQKRLQKLVEMNKKNNWFIIFLCTFLMLNNYEAATVHDHNFVLTNGLNTRFSDQTLIQRYHVGAKTLLTYFRYYCKGQVPFQLEYKDGAGKLTAFNKAQEVYMREMTQCISEQVDHLRSLENSESYHADLHLVSKLFSKDWDSSNVFKNLQ